MYCMDIGIIKFCKPLNIMQQLKQLKEPLQNMTMKVAGT